MTATFQWNYTTWLDLLALGILALFAWFHLGKISGARTKYAASRSTPVESHATP